ncbi:hypothetical protein JCM24511_03493 [Saitozyma sp. JCM 24511]|nr:hypothetical protein JCM24511_03493 [Saitozyma sp. JCM 24511]
MAEPRPSTDEESAPLLDRDRRDPDSLFSALMHPTRPLSNLEKVLAAGSIILLLLMCTFIGLFAGAEVQLKKERAGKGHEGSGTVTTTWTETATATSTKVATTTVGSVPTGKPEAPICLSANCIRVAADILDSLNTTADPCHDFYEFAVGGWVDSNEIPADRGIYSSFNVVADRNKKILLKVINSIDGTKTPNSAEESNQRKIKAVYESCMDLSQLNEVGIKPFVPLADFLIDTFGPFDLNPAPDAEVQSAETEWRGSWHEAYEVPHELVARSERLEELRVAAKTGGRVWDRPTMERSELLDNDDDVEWIKPDTERRDRITKTLAWLHSRGVEGLVNFEIEGDAGGEDSQVQSLWLYQSFGGLPSKEYYEEAPILDLYQSVVAGMLTDIASNTHASNKHPKRDVFDEFLQELAEVEAEGWPWPWPGDDKDGGDNDGGKQPDVPGSKDEPLDKRMEKLAGKVVRFERELMRAGADPEYLFNPHFAYNPYPVQKVYKALPFLDIPAYLSTFAPRTYPENITVTHPPYLKAVSQIVENTPDYVLSGYFVTRLAMTYAGALGQKTGVWKEARRLKEVLQGIKKGTEENRQDTCLNWLDGIVGYIVGREFVHEAFSAEAKKEGEDIINSIVKAFHDKLPHISWMDAESAKAAQKKAEAIIPKVGYPLTPDTTNPGALQFWYRMLEIKGDDFFGNVLRSTLVEEARTWQTLGRKRDRQTWEMYPQTVNAYYSPPDGEIVFPAGILQPPFYDFSWPAHLKYGSFGAVAAHELTHAFDNSGSQYDEKGRLRDWWTNETVAAFEEKAQCIAKQYSKYYIVGPDGKKEHINGNVSLTNGEDIADSGLAQAFTAWKSSLSKDDAPLRLPGLEHYTPEQLFFISFGRTWETLIRPQTAVVRIRTDPHSPGYWRAVGTLRNLPAFHQAFDCPVGSRMNPPKEEQCQLW